MKYRKARIRQDLEAIHWRIAKMIIDLDEMPDKPPGSYNEAKDHCELWDKFTNRYGVRDHLDQEAEQMASSVKRIADDIMECAKLADEIKTSFYGYTRDHD